MTAPFLPSQPTLSTPGRDIEPLKRRRQILEALRLDLPRFGQIRWQAFATHSGQVLGDHGADVLARRAVFAEG